MADFRLDLDIDFPPGTGASAPTKVELDFDELLECGPGDPLVDPHSIRVKRRLDRCVRTYNVQFSELLNTGNRGWIAWLADDPSAGGKWWIEGSLRPPDGRMAPAPNRPRVGIGDELYLNNGRWQRLDTHGYHPSPIAVDWNGNGLIDLVASSHHTGTYRMPWQGFYFWRNIGTNARPRFAAPLRLYATGGGKTEWFDEWYPWYDVFDWFGSGRCDLITVSRDHGIRVFRNTGDTDRAGLPRLELAQTIERPGCLAPGMYTKVRVVDWDGSGRPSLVLGTLYADKTDYLFLEQFVLMLNRGRTRRGEWKFQAKPIGIEYKSQPSRMLLPTGFWQGGATAPSDNWHSYTNTMNHRCFSFDVFDIDGDGREELLTCHVKHIPGPVIEVWRNVGTVEDPVLYYEDILPWSASYTTFNFRFVRNAAFDGCLWAPFHSGTGISYFGRTGRHYLDHGAYRNHGYLLGEGCKLKVEGYCRPQPIALSSTRGGKRKRSARGRSGGSIGPEEFALLCGDEPGFVTLSRPNGREGFQLQERMTNRRGEVLHLNREHVIPDNDSERNSGQLKPCLCDWDGDGRLDIILGGNTDRIFWLENYDPRTNSYARRHRLRVKGVHNPFAARKGPAACDIFRRGRPDLIAVDSQLRVAVFRQGRGARGRVELQPGIPLCYEDGEAITIMSIGPPPIHIPNICLAVCDWRERGVDDLIISSSHQTFLLENAGTSRRPAYRRPVPFTEPDGTIVDTSHHESHVAVFDWDGDGREDLMIGGEAGTIYLFHRSWLEGLEPRITVAKRGCP